MRKISAVIITYNEEANIERCLNSMQNVVDEVVVVDSFSTDRTREICKKYGARTHQYEWKGYAATKNYGNKMASYDFILSIDADEALSPELADSILTAKKNLSGAYTFNRLTNYCGHWIYHCGWYPDKKLRLFNRGEAEWRGDFVHESLVLKNPAPPTHLAGDLLHYSFSTLFDHLERVNKYSELAAREMIEKNRAGSFFKLLASPGVKFLKSYVFQKGFLDGYYGFCISAISAFDVFIRNAKVIQLWGEKQAGKKH